jgi:hypothetical protein
MTTTVRASGARALKKFLNDLFYGEPVALIADPQIVREIRADPWAWFPEIGKCPPDFGFLILKEIARLECLEAAARWRFEEQRYQGPNARPLEEWPASTELMMPRAEVLAKFEEAFRQITNDLLDDWLGWPDFIKPRVRDEPPVRPGV